MKKIKKILIVLLIVGFTLPVFAGEKENLALKIYVDTAVLKTQIKELQLLKKQIEADQKKLNALIRGEKPELEEERREEGK